MRALNTPRTSRGPWWLTGDSGGPGGLPLPHIEIFILSMVGGGRPPEPPEPRGPTARYSLAEIDRRPFAPTRAVTSRGGRS